MVSHHLPRRPQGMIPGGPHSQWDGSGHGGVGGMRGTPPPQHHMQGHAPQMHQQQHQQYGSGYGAHPQVMQAPQMMHAPLGGGQMYYDASGMLVAQPQMIAPNGQPVQYVQHNGMQMMVVQAPQGMLMPQHQQPQAQQQAVGQGGSFFAAMRPPVAHGAGGYVPQAMGAYGGAPQQQYQQPQPHQNPFQPLQDGYR